MRAGICLGILVVFVSCAVLDAAEEAVKNSRIESIGMFKNGLAVVRRTVEIDGPGTYRIEDVPMPVHGTFSIGSSVPVAVRSTLRETDVPLRERAGVNFQQELVGKTVTVHLRDSETPVKGRVVKMNAATANDAFSRRYEAPSYRPWGGMIESESVQQAEKFLVLETDGDRIYVDTSSIAQLRVSDAGETVRQRVPVLLFEVGGEKKPSAITISYLSKGIAWAPAYRVELVDDKQLKIEQTAIVKNELGGIEEAELVLISGFPAIEFSHVLSPLSPETSLASFFQQINNPPNRGQDSNVIMNQMAVVNVSANELDLSAIPAGEGADLHYESIGKRTLSMGDALSLSVTSGQAGYERIVEWVVADPRDVNGYRRSAENERQDDVWDAVRFKNPLSFAMTTGPAAIWSNGRFLGQHTSYWTNVGEQMTLHVTKALSIRTRAQEVEQNRDREITYIGGRQFRKAYVDGELVISNHRNEAVRVVIRRQFSGDLITADGEPKLTLRDEGVSSVNRRNELRWEVPLNGGESKTLKYSYSVLAAN